MATHSTVPTVRTTLLALLGARDALAGVQISDTHPGDAREVESVYLGEARGDDRIPTIRAGRKVRQEAYTLDVWFDCAGDGPTAKTASERAWAFFGELEDILADDPSLGLAPPFWAALADWTETIFFDEARRGFGSLLRAGVHCKARLS